VVKQRYVPARGDVVWLTFDPQAGHEQAGRRPALVISPASYNGTVGLGIFCPLTKQPKGYAWEVVVPKGYKVTGAVLSDQVKSCDWKARNAEFICHLPDGVVEDVLQKLAPLLEPDEE
jgi:mRNA interferase MazF